MKQPFFLSLCAAILQALLIVGAPAPENECKERQGTRRTYDYIIVGGGTAGLVMAERLSEDPTVQVAVIEAGTFYELTDPLYKVPAEDGMFVGSRPQDTNPLVDWNFVTEPQSGANGRKIHYARGKCLGGSSGKWHFGDTMPHGCMSTDRIYSQKLHDLSTRHRSDVPKVGRRS